MKIAATIQARTGSSRLPNKVMLPILGEPMLARQVERIKRSQLIDEIIIATSTKKQDDCLEDLAGAIGISCFRGSEDLVIDRVIGALKQFSVDIHVSFCGDCPMPDPTIIDTIIGIYLKNIKDYDYVGTGMKTTYPPGLEVSVYPSEILFDVDGQIQNLEEREHVGANIISRKDRYRVLNVEAPPWYHYPDLYLEVDTKEDFLVTTNIYESLYPRNPYFLLPDIIEFLKENPSLAESNQGVHRRWKKFRDD